jgi:hypothetical protein
MEGPTREYLTQLASIAGDMRRMRRSNSATVAYSLLADALYWSDEIPILPDDKSDDVLRFLLRYRTTLILGKPNDALEPYWAEALRQFPTWVGFEESRRTPGPKLQAVYHARKEQAMKDVMQGIDL